MCLSSWVRSRRHHWREQNGRVEVLRMCTRSLGRSRGGDILRTG